jgi:hypothetical protein
MIRTWERFSIVCLGCCAMATAANAAGTEAAVVNGPSGAEHANPVVAKDPCADFDLSRIPGLRGTMIGLVHPSQFSQGDQVTVCGRGLSMTRLIENYQPEVGGPLAAGDFIEIGDETTKRGWRVQVFGASTSPTGDRITFVVGGLFQSYVQRSNSSSMYYLVPAGRAGLREAQPQVQGELKLVTSGSRFAPPKAVGPVVTWVAGGPKLRAAYGRFFSRREPFVITPQALDQVISVELGLITLEGGNLGAGEFLIRDMPLKTFHNPGEDGTMVVAAVPQKAVSGPVCAVSDGARNCLDPLTVQRGPTVTRTPQMPLELRTSYVIEGTDLKPNVPGLTYHMVMSGLTGEPSCAQVLKVIDHTARRIEFSLGEVSDSTPIPVACARAANYQPPQENPSNLIFLMARYKNQERPLYQMHYYIAPPRS